MDIRLVAFKDHCAHIPESVDDFMAYWKGALEKIPEEFRSSALIDIDAREEYGGAYIDVEITYLRPETEDEENRRTNASYERHAAVEERERRELQRLQSKYGS